MPQQARELTELFQELTASDNVSYILGSDLSLLRTNAAWDVFAHANDGEDVLLRWPPHTSMLDAIPAVLRPFYINGFARAASENNHWEHDYECSSPTQFRRFRMIVYPLETRFVVTHALLVEQPHDREVMIANSADYVREGLLLMCSHCRRVRCRAIERPRWDWVPSYIDARVRNVSHGLCDPCARYYYGDPG